MTVHFAFDRSVRIINADGRMDVRISNISKATVNPYRGAEIPGGRELGLDPSRVYNLLRHPDELKKAAPTFNNLPLLIKHVPVNAFEYDSHQADLVVGSTGTDAAFDGTYLTNSLVIWAREAIEGIESREQQELSSAYRYVADMSPGTYEGLHYDGIMRNIVGNHVALVTEGRAGADVVVGDSQFEGHMKLNTRTALLLSGALVGRVTPLLAQDKKFDPSPLLTKVTRANLATDAADLAKRLHKTIKPLLAADGDLDVEDVTKLIAAVQGSAPPVTEDEPDAIPDVDPEEPAAVDADGDLLAKICAALEGKVDDETLAAIRAMGGEDPAEDEFPEKKPDDKDDKPAMDRKLRKPPVVALDAAAIRAAAMADMNAIRTAERAVFAHVGEVAAMDSADAVYRYCLDKAGVSTKGITGPALAAMVGMLPDPSDAPRPLAMDSRKPSGLTERFPAAKRLKRA